MANKSDVVKMLEKYKKEFDSCTNNMDIYRGMDDILFAMAERDRGIYGRIVSDLMRVVTKEQTGSEKDK
ncbi:MAG: hypothetical protein GY679_01860 [Mycoplasma sp.]|nr:hypothetical protein [Mycoplasma sp.]